MKKFIIIIGLIVINKSNLIAQNVTVFVRALDNNNALIQGESTDASHSNEIVATTFGQTSALCTPSQSCGVASGNFILNIAISKAVNPLKRSMYLNQPLNSVDVVFRKASATPFEYYKIHMENVTVTSVSESESAGENNLFQIYLDPQKFQWSYIPQLNSGQAGTPIKFGWNKLTNTEYVF
jgi:type VI protein secretion system component Hcp